MFGKLIESELLGETKKEIGIYQELHETPSYLKYRPSVEYVKTHQRGDPYNPKRFFPKSLRDGLKQSDVLGVVDEEQIGYYTALDSSLDRFHGVDAFFEYKKGTQEVIVTLDVTTNPHKDNYKADVVLAIPSEGLDPNDANYHLLIEGYVEQIIEKLLTKIRK